MFQELKPLYGLLIKKKISQFFKKIWPHFISGYSMKKRSWSSAFDFKTSGTQK